MTVQTAVRDEAEAVERIRAAASSVGARVFAHALDIDTGQEVGVGSDEPTVAASVFKVPVLVEYVRQVARGELDPAARIRIRAEDAVAGPSGLSVFSDDAEWSLRDLATSMITVSDNTATDVVIERIGGVERVNATLDELRLPATRLVGDCATLLASLTRELDAGDAASDRIADFEVCTPMRTSRTTPKEAARILQLLWLDHASTPEACAEARRILGLQVWPHRLTSGFPRDDLRISGKTGTIGIVRNEIGVVEFPEGPRHAIAVFVRTDEYRLRNPAADALIGQVGRILSDCLRRR